MNLPWRSILLAIFVSLIAAGAARAQGTEGPNQRPFREIELNLTQAVVNQTLPFDVPFVLYGSVPSTVKLVRGYLDRPRLLSPLTVPAPTAARRTTCDGVEWLPRDPGNPDAPTNEVSTWVVAPPGATATPSTAATRTFRLLYPALEVNTNYCIHFELERSVTPAEAAAFGPRAFRAIDDELRRLSLLNRNIGNADLELLRQRLITAIRDTNSNIRTTPGTLFDPRPPNVMGDDLTLAQRDLARRINPALQPQFQKVLILVDFDRETKAAQAAAEKIRIHALLVANADAVGKLLAATQATAAADAAALQTLLKGSTTALSEMISGVTALQPGGLAAPPIAGIWTVTSRDPCRVDEVQTVLANIRASSEFFGRLADALEKVLTAAPEADRASLLALIRGDGGVRRSLLGSSSALADVPELLCDRTRAIDRIVADLEVVVKDNVSLLITTTGDFASRHSWYFSVDVGLAAAPVIGEIFPYVGVNMYFRPVNKEAPLSSLTNTFGRRFSLMLGYTWTDNLLKDDQRLGIFTRDNAVGTTVTGKEADAMLVFGAGIRITDALRIAGGGLLFKSSDPNPFITDTDLQVTPFFSLSWDWDAVGNIKGLGGLMGLGGTPVPVAIGKRDPPPADPAAPQPATPEPAAPQP